MSEDLDLPASLRMRAGETWQVRLAGLGSAGYGWQVELGDPTVAEVDLRAIAPADDTHPGGPPPDAYSADQLLTLRALRKGRTTVRLRQSRPWEAEHPPHRAHDMPLVVE